MKDNIIFYSIVASKTYFLFGLKFKQKKYSIIEYDYNNPIDDSSIVPLFGKDFSPFLIKQTELLSIIKKTVYPNFMKLNDNGLTYLIKINHINDTNIYLNQFKQNNHKWSQLKWIDIDDYINMRDIVDIQSREIINKYKIIPFIKNQYKVNTLLYTQQDFDLINNLINNKQKQKQIKLNKDNNTSSYEKALLTHFKNYQYNQMLSIYNYTTYCTSMNELMRYILTPDNTINNSKLMCNNNKEHIRNAINIINIINNAPKYDAFDSHYICLYRGLSFNPELINGQITDIFKYSFISTSWNIHIASNAFVPNGGALFKIIILADTPLLATKQISHHPYEDEILLPPGLEFRVIKVDKSFNKDLQRIQPYYTLVLHQISNISDILLTLA